LNQNSTSFEPKNLFDPENIDERRKSVGLNTLEEYIEIANKRFYGELLNTKK
jgi:hypothetical protein